MAEHSTELTPEFNSVQKFNTDLTPDCAKFCPLAEYQSLLLIAFYELRDQKVLGSLHLYELKKNQIDKIQEIDSPGVLDFQWFPALIDGKAYVCTACSDSFVRIYSISDERQLICMQEIQTEAGQKCLYIDVAIVLNEVKIVVSSDIENVFLITLSTSDKTKQSIQTTKSHQYSVWACAISKENTNLFLSGGDDQNLILHDSRVEDFKVAQNKRTHQMGICTINFNPKDSNQFFTGSYDEHLRLWDIRNIAKPIFESKREGGVWRAVWKPTDSKQALLGVYCQKYFEIVDLYEQDVKQIQQLGNHESLAYSCDWNRSCSNIITCSFYDKLVQLWSN